MVCYSFFSTLLHSLLAIFSSSRINLNQLRRLHKMCETLQKSLPLQITSGLFLKLQHSTILSINRAKHGLNTNKQSHFFHPVNYRQQILQKILRPNSILIQTVEFQQRWNFLKNIGENKRKCSKNKEKQRIVWND